MTGNKTEPEKTVEMSETIKTKAGKRIRTFKLTLPVSGDTIDVIAPGLLTTRLIEKEMGWNVGKKKKGDPDHDDLIAQSQGIMYAFADNAEKLIQKFVPKHCPDLKMSDYTDDDLYAIVVNLYYRSAYGGGTVVSSFPSIPGGGEPGGDGVADEEGPK